VVAEDRISSAAVVFADRFYMSETSLAEITDLGGYAYADSLNAVDLAEKIGGSSSVKIIVSEYVPVNGPVLDKTPALKGVIAYGAGYDHLDAEALRRRGVQVCNCRGQNARSVAELAFGLALSLLRRIRQADSWVRAGEWPKAGRVLPEWASGRELGQKTLGIVGMGQIGARVVGMAKGFDMKVLGHDPFMKPEQYERLGVEPAALDELLSRSDVVTLHVPLTPETEQLLNARTLAGAKPGMILVNTSRGKVIDEEALVEALRTGLIAGAALDVFAVEPLPGNHPLTRMENVVLTPHLGALTREAGDRLSDSVARQAKDILEGRPPEGLIR
jgi:phosphoglycerate dehydrogenase-like enzyme